MNKKTNNLLAILILISVSPVSFAGYPPVTIENKTNYLIYGNVDYGSYVFCDPDDYMINPHTTWNANSRGLCLVMKITVNYEDEAMGPGDPYTSSGTSYSQFKAIDEGGVALKLVRK